MLQTYFLFLKQSLNKCQILELESRSKDWQNNLPFAFEMHSCKRNATSYQFIDNQGFSFKVHLFAYILRQSVLQEKESFYDGGPWMIALGNHLLIWEHLESYVNLRRSSIHCLFSKISSLSLQSTLKQTFGFRGHCKIWAGALYGLVFLWTEWAPHLCKALQLLLWQWEESSRESHI